VLLNKAAVEAMNLKNPVGKKLRLGNQYTIIGVIDNVVMESPFKPVDPIMIYFEPARGNTITLRLNAGAQTSQAIAAIESVFKKYNPAYPFEYKFVDQEFAKKYLTEELISKLTNVFAGLAIFICCMGLAGLAAFTIEKRIREIGIRKVLGATISQLIMLISKEFLRLVAIALLVSVPLTWWLMGNWLQKYSYRIDISVWIFLGVGALVLLLALMVVGLNTMKAALRNPVRSLRVE
jgi:putative ABC transport system permease protein